MNQTNEEVKNLINIQIADEEYQLAAQKLVQRALTNEELVKIREGFLKEVEGYICGRMEDFVSEVISQFLKNKSRKVGASTPRYEVNICEYHNMGEHQMKYQCAFKTEQDAREYVVLQHPNRRVKIAKVDVVFETQPSVEDEVIPF